MGSSIVSAAGETTLRGQIVDYTGSPIPQRYVTLSIREGGHEEVTTDSQGKFEAELPSNEICDIGFYRYKYGPKESEPNGVPHMYVIGEFSTGTGETDLGELHIEKGHLVQAQALDADGNPVGNAGADLTVKGQTGHYLGTGGNLRTNHNGYVVVDDAPYAGMELTGLVELSISIPNDNGGNIEYSREFFVEEPLSITAQIDEGMSISSADEGSSDSDDQTSDTDDGTSGSEDQTSNTDDGTSEPDDQTSNTDDGTSGSEDQTSDEPSNSTSDSSTETSDRDTGGTSDKSSEKDGTHNNSESASNESQHEEVTGETRGFFSNDAADEEYGMLSDPFTLTVGGFVLSAGGIAHQLIRGR
ncbi:hypothetical protein ACFQO4_14530 [Saliphagus sp. GCM10025334]